MARNTDLNLLVIISVVGMLQHIISINNAPDGIDGNHSSFIDKSNSLHHLGWTKVGDPCAIAVAARCVLEINTIHHN